jgi:hypothetical protein
MVPVGLKTAGEGLRAHPLFAAFYRRGVAHLTALAIQKGRVEKELKAGTTF